MKRFVASVVMICLVVTTFLVMPMNGFAAASDWQMGWTITGEGEKSSSASGELGLFSENTEPMIAKKGI